MNYNYETRNEFMDAYSNGTLNEFNEKLYDDYIDFNFDSDDLFDYNIDLKYIKSKSYYNIINYNDQCIYKYRFIQDN